MKISCASSLEGCNLTAAGIDDHDDVTTLMKKIKQKKGFYLVP